MDARYLLRELRVIPNGMSAALRAFLISNGLDPDGDADYSVVVEDDGEIIATGSSFKNVIKFVAIAALHRSEGLLAPVMTALMRHMAEIAETHIFIYTSPDKRGTFAAMGFSPVAETSDVVLLENKKNGINQWLTEIKLDTVKKFGSTPPHGKTGVIVMNCDPFTKGHRYLIEQASAETSLLHLFILSSGGMFTPDERFSMVLSGISDISNIALHRASDYVVSPATFPTYFTKASGNEGEVSSALDLKIFAGLIAPALGITTRFAGTEPYCGVTNKYNRMMRGLLPQHGIEFIEIPRFEVSGRAVSASDVRRLYKERNWSDIRKLVPETTFSIINNLPGR